VQGVEVDREFNRQLHQSNERSTMRTRRTIMAIVLAAAAGTIGGIALLVILLGRLGLVMAALGASTVLVVYRLWVQPWQHRCGATDEEVRRPMPGDDLIPDASGATRAMPASAISPTGPAIVARPTPTALGWRCGGSVRSLSG
jgi:hypothetical protein